jgi:hypothetical protein
MKITCRGKSFEGTPKECIAWMDKNGIILTTEEFKELRKSAHDAIGVTAATEVRAEMRRKFIK